MMKTLRTIAVGLVLLIVGARACMASPVLMMVADVPLPGRATRFDYQSFDPKTKMLYFTHMGDGELVVFDTVNRQVVAHLAGFPTATGVLVVPKLQQVFVSVAGRHEVAVVDMQSMKVLARVPAGDFPDGLAYAPDVNKLFVSDESGGLESVIDVGAYRRVNSIDLGGEIGNTQYDPVAHRIYANVQNRNQLVVIDPQTDAVIARHDLNGGDGPHGLLVLESGDLAFAACENDAKLLVVDLESFQVRQVLTTGYGPDVLAFDSGLQWLYVASESGTVSVFQLREGSLTKLEDLAVGHHAHTISVNPENHEVYLPLQDVDGRPVLRIMQAVEPHKK